MAETPKVFISYSHDSPAHKQWVAELATRLRRAGVDAILDQWDLSLGDDVTRFMEEGVGSADRVLVVCTDEYVRKADAGKGGVGYERLIVTAELVENLGTNKFIPVIRHVAGKSKTPKFLGVRMFIDFSDDEEFDAKLDDLLRELHKAPTLEKPPLGKNPYAVTSSGEGISVTKGAQLVTIPNHSFDPVETYHIAVNLARSNDLIGWRQLVKRVRAPVNAFLLEWRRKYEHQLPQENDVLRAAVEESVSGIAPLLVIALAGVESGRPEFNDQRSLLDDIYEIDGWSLSGITAVVFLPETLCFIYQALHGAVSLLTGQLDVALALIDMEVRDKYSGDFHELLRMHKIIGWPESLGRNFVEAWKFLTSATERWPWLVEIFGSERDYRAALAAYYMALNIYELVGDIAAGRAKDYENAQASSFIFFVPMTFLLDEESLQRRAFSMLIRKNEALSALWERKGLKQEDVEAVWPHWVKIIKSFNAYHNLGAYRLAIAHETLFESIGK